MSSTNDTPEVAATVLAIEEYWGEMAKTWPWMLQQSLRPVYLLTGELLIGLTRAYPAMISSNQMRWYARQVSGTPSIYVLFPEQFKEESLKRIGGSDPRSIDGKSAVTFLYLATEAGVTTPAKSLLLSTEKNAPMFRTQVAHELLNCACATDWDNDTLRAGVRQVHWKTGSAMQRGGALNDLLIDTLLLDFLPTTDAYTRGSLLEGQQGPYWQIVEAFGTKIPQVTITTALFGDSFERKTLADLLNEVTERKDAITFVDRLLEGRDWAALQNLFGVIPNGM